MPKSQTRHAWAGFLLQEGFAKLAYLLLLVGWPNICCIQVEVRGEGGWTRLSNNARVRLPEPAKQMSLTSPAPLISLWSLSFRRHVDLLGRCFVVEEPRVFWTRTPPGGIYLISFNCSMFAARSSKLCPGSKGPSINKPQSFWRMIFIFVSLSATGTFLTELWSCKLTRSWSEANTSVWLSNNNRFAPCLCRPGYCNAMWRMCARMTTHK